ncbi:hypothetical protein RUM44_007309 [Polyplax serrata]|uniref:Uncharacterized protein n=1 Tax=Polyplax serrata TaxID=468196 RepID=A0ABR1B0B5_POLSC
MKPEWAYITSITPMKYSPFSGEEDDTPGYECSGFEAQQRESIKTISPHEFENKRASAFLKENQPEPEVNRFKIQFGHLSQQSGNESTKDRDGRQPAKVNLKDPVRRIGRWPGVPWAEHAVGNVRIVSTYPQVHPTHKRKRTCYVKIAAGERSRLLSGSDSRSTSSSGFVAEFKVANQLVRGPLKHVRQ